MQHDWQKVTSVSTTWNYEPVKGLVCHVIIWWVRDFVFSYPRKTEREALCFVIYFFFNTEEVYNTDRLWIILSYLSHAFIPFFKSRYSVLSNICGYDGVS